jgi:hypothetical protein
MTWIAAGKSARTMSFASGERIVVPVLASISAVFWSWLRPSSLQTIRARR